MTSTRPKQRQFGLRDLCWPLLLAEAFVGWHLIRTRLDREAKQTPARLPISAQRTEDAAEPAVASEETAKNDQNGSDTAKAASSSSTGLAERRPKHSKVPWIEFSELEFRRARDSAKPCVVVYWADWMHLAVHHKWMFESSLEIQRLIDEHQIIALLVDCSDRDFETFAWELLGSVGIDSIPVTLCYPADPGASPIIVEALPNRPEFIDALRRISAPPGQ